jgi:NadR type nicotinamide-nucleotide adenylyltransferase
MQSNPNTNHIKKVVIIGPECTGKSELSEFLASHFNTCWVPEYARAYLDNLSRSYEESDLLKIAHGQLRMEDEWISEANRIMICDTNLLVIKIWSEFKYGRCNEEILNLIESREYDLYLFTHIDIPWQDDLQREHPNKRQELWEIYKAELSKLNTPVIEIKGERKIRRRIAIEAIESLLNTKA